ncbi:hypothetical protein [Citreimonas salinaria]|uniref:Lipopolysaccharide export system protein LptC n=1 Tax=Citreimonas salinaria TaxID=321339 RepID=A0A1H3LTV2_9RHOB|nr:hypothetical protein [Citreimonas salinaria]SDY67831.1 lipopolysaccharide export system protein LptC [Citreimonas salinaria]
MRTGFYSRIIAWLKILLPLAALVLLSTLFLLSRDTQDAIAPEIGARLGVDGVSREQVREPSFAGVTERGETVSVVARSARPEGDGAVVAETVTAIVTLDDGTRIEMMAPSARLTESENEARLEGGVRFRSTSGYSFETEGLVARLDTVAGRSLGSIKGEAPAGTIEAGGMSISPGATKDDVQLVFTESVKMVYVPQFEPETP